MTKELQDHVWSILPKEFRKEVKKMYESTQLTGLQPFEDVERADRYAEAMCAIFGEDNLTSDADELRKNGYEELSGKRLKRYKLTAEVQFGKEDNFPTKKPKPAEPKFKIGDELVCDKRLVVKVDEVFADGKYLVFSRTGNRYMVKESDLEPYIEPEENQNPSDSTKLKPQDVDKHFDNILKDSFREHNRLHIAAMMVPSVIATVPCSENEKGYAKMVATRSRILADALISECNKGVSK